MTTSAVALGWDDAATAEFGADLTARMINVNIALPLYRRLKAIGLPPNGVERIAESQVRWDFVDDLLQSPGLRKSTDVNGLLVLVQSLPEGEVKRWAHLGSLEAAFRLYGKGISANTASSFPLQGDGLDGLLKMSVESSRHGLHQDDLLYWYAGGVLRLTFPYINERQFAAWRKVGMHALGMRLSALACAAGLGPGEATVGVQDGSYTEEGLRLLAGLRLSAAV